MRHTGETLSGFFARHAERGDPLVMATVVETAGSTYRKPGAHMLIAGDGAVAGLLSGGCLEADLLERARAVLETGAAVRVEYDTRSSDDLIWGIGLGCEGAMSILLTRLDRGNAYQPFSFVESCRTHDRPGRFAVVIESDSPGPGLGAAFWPGAAGAPPQILADITSGDADPHRSAAGLRAVRVLQSEHWTALSIPVELPPRLLVLGAGPDAAPLVDIAALTGWRVDVLDHRPAYAIAERFPRAARVGCQPAQRLTEELTHSRFDAAVVMSHHLFSDQTYLEALAASSVPYVGLLGPAPRRSRLLTEIGDKAANLSDRLYGPVGLDIGARTPETIALAIVSEIHAVLSGRSGGSFSR